MISVDDGTKELALITDVSMGGSSMSDGSVEIMVHRRCQADDHRGVQEPLNETMCGCNDIGALPGKMGAHGREGDGGCLCEGLTMRGTAYLIVDTVEKAHARRRELVETANFPPTLAFTKGTVAKPKLSAIAKALPANIKLVTISNNYAAWNDGKLILRLSHMYAVGEHIALSQPVTISLAETFAKAGLKVMSAEEMMLTANQPKATFEAKKKSWSSASSYANANVEGAQTERRWLDPAEAGMTVTINAMEVKTFLVDVG